MKKLISSRTTQFWKIVFPIGFGISFGLITLGLFLSPESAGPGWLKYYFLFVTVTALTLILILHRPLKEVWQDENNFYIRSPGGREIMVPLTEVEKISLYKWIHFGYHFPIVITFAKPTPAGEKIMFIPQSKRLPPVLSYYPTPLIVGKLQQAVERAKLPAKQ